MKTRFTYLILISIFLSSCFKEDSAVSPIKPGEIETVQIEIGYPYVNQVYYDCGTNKVVSTNSKYAWDLAFECTPTGFHVLLNTAKGEFVADYGDVPFSSVNSVVNAVWFWDVPSGNLDSTGIGDWRNNSNVFVLDLQFDANGNHLGYKKFQMQYVTATNYSFKYANLDGTDENIYIITKNQSINFIHFSFQNNGQTLVLEPEKNSWDLLFSNHYHKFSNLPLPFVLTQVLINNQNGVKAAEDNNNIFYEIKLSDTANFTYTTAWDEIGYDWKIRNSQDNSFDIDPNKSFVLKTTEGLFYKIKFTDFYDDFGTKGYPKFEIQKL